MSSAAFIAAIALAPTMFCGPPDIPWNLFGAKGAIELVGLTSTTICKLDARGGAFQCPGKTGDRITVTGDGKKITIDWKGLSEPISFVAAPDGKPCQ
jgi:hypothetical protein